LFAGSILEGLALLAGSVSVSVRSGSVRSLRRLCSQAPHALFAGSVCRFHMLCSQAPHALALFAGSGSVLSLLEGSVRRLHMLCSQALFAGSVRKLCSQGLFAGSTYSLRRLRTFWLCSQVLALFCSQVLSLLEGSVRAGSVRPCPSIAGQSMWNLQTEPANRACGACEQSLRRL